MNLKLSVVIFLILFDVLQVGMGALETYQIDFEEPLLKDTAAYYRLKAAAWIQEDSTPDFLVKAEQCLKAEEARVDSYLHASTKAKLLKEVGFFLFLFLPFCICFCVYLMTISRVYTALSFYYLY